MGHTNHGGRTSLLLNSHVALASDLQTNHVRTTCLSEPLKAFILNYQLFVSSLFQAFHCRMTEEQNAALQRLK